MTSPRTGSPRINSPSGELILTAAGNASLSKQQAAFNRQIKRIDALRARLADWQVFETAHHRQVATVLQPLRDRLLQDKKQMALAMDRWLTQPPKGLRLGRRQQQTTQRMLLLLLRDVLSIEADDVLMALHDRYSETSHAEQRDSELAALSDRLTDVYGADIVGDYQAQSPEDLLRHAQQKLDERMAFEAEQRAASQAHQEANSAAAGQGKQRLDDASAHRKKEDAAKEATQSVREVYRKLASALHPDRAIDAADGVWRTAMMQRVNQAYERVDLLTLLTLQMETEQINPDQLSRMGDERLLRYNAVLKDQLKQLESELADIEARYASLAQDPFGPRVVTPQWVQRLLDEDVQALQAVIEDIEWDLARADNPDHVREMLARQGRALAESDRDAMDEDDVAMVMAAMEDMGLFNEPAPRKRRR